MEAFKKRRSSNGVNTCTELKFRDITYRDPELIANQWGLYFRELYMDTEDPSFDDAFKERIDAEVASLKCIPSNLIRLRTMS